MEGIEDSPFLHEKTSAYPDDKEDPVFLVDLKQV